MPNPVRVPRRYRGTDLQSAYLDGHEDSAVGRQRSIFASNFCPAEQEAYQRGFRDGERERGQLDL